MTRDPSSPTLLRLLTWPFLAVVLALAALVGWLSYRSAHGAVDDAAQQWLSASLQRVGDEIERQQRQADAWLQAALPDGIRVPLDFSDEHDQLAQRLWMASLLHPQDRGRISVVNRSGQALTLQHLGKGDAVLEFRRGPEGPTQRQFWGQGPAALATLSGEAASPAVSFPERGPRELEWAREALKSDRAGWSSIDLHATGEGPTLSRTRPIKDAHGQTVGVLAAPFSLQPIQDAVAGLKLPPRGVAFVVERSGLLIAASAGPLVRKGPNGNPQRIHVHDSDSDLMRAAYERTLPHMGSHSLALPGRLTLSDPGMTSLVSSFGRLTDDGGNDWSLIVAAPRSVFTSNLLNTVIQTVAAALAASAAVLLIAAWIRQRLVRDVQALAHTLQGVSNGEWDTPPAAMHCAELSDLSDALRRTQMRIRNDRSLGLVNREAILGRLHDRVRPGRRHNDAPLLALLAVDLNRFADVNRQHGHEAGDFVLQTLGKRLRQTVRDTDLVTRWSSDEFVVLLDGVASVEDAHRVRDQVERVLRDPVELGPGRDAVEIDGTAGLAITNVNTESSEPETLLRDAQADLAQRKPQVRPKGAPG